MQHIIICLFIDYNNLGTLGCFTESPKSVEAKLIFERGNYNIVEEVKPVYAEGLDNVSIVKVVCGDNATFTISDQGHLYAISIFKAYRFSIILLLMLYIYQIRTKFFEIRARMELLDFLIISVLSNQYLHNILHSKILKLSIYQQVLIMLWPLLQKNMYIREEVTRSAILKKTFDM